MTALMVSAYTAFLAAGLLAAVALVFHFRDRRVDWLQHVRRLRERPWTGRDAVLLAAVLAGLLGLTLSSRALLERFFHPADAGRTATAGMVVQSVVFDWAGLAAIAVLLARRRLPWRSAFGLEPRGLTRQLGLGLLFYLATMPFFWFYSTLYQLGLKWLGMDPTMQEVAAAITAVESLGVRIYLITLAVVIAPVFEELLFRGILLPAAARRLGVGRAILLTSLTFAAIHCHLPSFLPLFLIAVAFALAYLYTESILVPVVMHSLFNAVNLALLTVLHDTL